MASEILSTSYIDSLIYNYEVSQKKQLLQPLQTRKTKYEKLDSAYSTISTKLSALKASLTELKNLETDSIFNQKSAESSNTNFMSASATNSASKGSYEFRINQLAKNDLVVSNDFATDTANAITGIHNFLIKTGDGSTGEYISNIEVEFDTNETNETMIEKIRNAINSDKAVVDSDAFVATDSYTGGASSFTFDINGTETTIDITGGGTYEDLMNELVSTINDDVDGVTAEKVSDSGNVSLKITVDNPDDYISISHDSGFDLVSSINIGVTKEKGASGTVTASMFSPTSGETQLSLTSKTTGLDYRITELSDSGTSTALDSLGLNLGTSRPSFDQSTDPDVAGFVYSDITDSNNLLNSKFLFNGLNLQNNLNEISDLSTGVTFELKSVMQDTDSAVNISVGINSEAITEKINDFITKFNDVYSYIKNESASTSDSRGSLTADSNATTILSNLRSSVLGQVPGIATGNISFLSQMGISFNYASGLSVSDSDLLEEKITGSLGQVADMFNSTDGIANVLYDYVNPYLGIDGYLSKAQDIFSDNMTNVSDRIKAAEARISKSSDTLRGRYQHLQTQLSSLISLQSMFDFSSSGS